MQKLAQGSCAMHGAFALSNFLFPGQSYHR